MTNGTHANESFRFSQHHCYSSPPPPNKIPQVDGDGEEESISELDLKMAYKMSCFLNDDRWGDGTKNDGRFTFYQACGKHMKIGVLFGLVDSTHHNYSRRCKECNMSRLNDTWLLHVSLIPSKTTNASTALAFHPRFFVG
nr:hypothetical protein [Tanacetum cinerariifolium]